jgi:uncharacterized pyridoxal phosphate-containing UPF0001 family protein
LVAGALRGKTFSYQRNKVNCVTKNFTAMKHPNLKETLIKIADNVDDKTTFEDVLKQLTFLLDIEQSEQDEKDGNIFTQQEVEKISKEWLK